MQVRTVAFYNRPFPSGGAETVTRNLAYFFHNKGTRVIVYTSHLHEELLREQDREQFETRILPDPKIESSPGNIDFLRKSLSAEQVDVLIVQGVPDFPFAEIRDHVKTRLLFCLHSIPLWEEKDWLQSKANQARNWSLFRRLKYKWFKIPYFRLTNKIRNEYLKIYAHTLQSVDRFVTLCPQYHQRMEQLLLRSGYVDKQDTCGKFASVANPLLPAEEPTRLPKEKTILYVGRLSHSDKRVDRLLKIWHSVEQKNPDWTLKIIGDGLAMESLIALSLQLKLQHVEFIGYQQDVAPYYRTASFVCLTSAFEGFGMSLVEAQQYGAIPVSFDSFDAIHEITENGQAGIPVRAYSLHRYAQELNAMIKDLQSQERMREACYIANRKYSLENIGQQWLRLFETL